MINILIKKSSELIHWEKYLEIDLVIQGTAVMTGNDARFEMKAGDLIVINREDIHSIDRTSEDLIYVQLQMDMKIFNQYIPDIENVYFKCYPETSNDVTINNLKNEIKNWIYYIVLNSETHENHEQSFNNITHAGIEILSILKQNFNLFEKSPTEYSDAEQFDRIWKVIDYMYDYHKEKLLLKQVAEQVHVSETHLSRILKEAMGLNFEELLGYIRAECALKYLLETELSVTMIAAECGFSAPRYFNNVFSRYYGCTPVEYRKKHKSRFMKTNNNIYQLDYITYEKDIDRHEVLRLLDKYKMPELLGEATNDIYMNVSLDLKEEISPGEINPYKKYTLVCGIEEILKYEKKEQFEECRDGLNVSSIYVTFSSDKKIQSIVEKNIKALCLNRAKLEVKGLHLNELFYENGQKKSPFYRQKLFNDVKEPLKQLNRHVLVYKQSDDKTNILLHNIDVIHEIHFNIVIENVINSYCVVEKVKTQVPIDEIMAFEEETSEKIFLSSQCLEKLTQPKESVEIIKETKFVITETLKYEQVCLITIKK